MSKTQNDGSKKKSGFVSLLDGKGLMNALMNSGLFLVGFIGGQEVSRIFFKPKDGVEAKTGLANFLGPLLKAGGGMFLANNKNEKLRFIGYGLTANGLLDGVKAVTKKDILANGLLGELGIDLGMLGLGSSNDYDLPPLPPVDGPNPAELPEHVGAVDEYAEYQDIV